MCIFLDSHFFANKFCFNSVLYLLEIQLKKQQLLDDKCREIKIHKIIICIKNINICMPPHYNILNCNI